MTVSAPTYDLRGANARHTLRPPLPVGTGLTSTGAGGAAAQVVIPADTARPIVLSQIFASLSASAAAAVTIIVLDGATEVFRHQIAVGANPGPITFDPPIAGTPGNSMTVTVSAPGGAVVASLNVNAYTLK